MYNNNKNKVRLVKINYKDIIVEGCLNKDAMLDVLYSVLTKDEIIEYLEELESIHQTVIDFDLEDDDSLEYKLSLVAIKNKVVLSKILLKIKSSTSKEFIISELKKVLENFNKDKFIERFENKLYDVKKEFLIKQFEILNILNLNKNILTLEDCMKLNNELENILSKKDIKEDIVMYDRYRYLYLEDIKNLESLCKEIKDDEVIIILNNR